jgi:hypothetical protein
MERYIPLDKLASVAATAPRDVVLVVDTDRIHANRMLLSLCSDFFEAMFRGSMADSNAGEVLLVDISAADVRQIVSYTEGGFEPSPSDDVAELMRMQDRFLMPALRRQCEVMLISSLSCSTWLAVARVAASYGSWDLVADAAVWASRQTWNRERQAAPFWVGICGAGSNSMASQACLARILREADFMCVSHKFAMMRTWVPDASLTDAAVVDALREDLLPTCNLWAVEVEYVLADDKAIPVALITDIARSIAIHGSEPRRRLRQHGGVLLSEHRRCMAKVDVSMVASMGTGHYQMVIVPKIGGIFDDAYFSNEVLMVANTEYHVYLNEDEQLGEWWRKSDSSGGLHVLVRFRAT